MPALGRRYNRGPQPSALTVHWKSDRSKTIGGSVIVTTKFKRKNNPLIIFCFCCHCCWRLFRGWNRGEICFTKIYLHLRILFNAWTLETSVRGQCFSSKSMKKKLYSDVICVISCYSNVLFWQVHSCICRYVLYLAKTLFNPPSAVNFSAVKCTHKQHVSFPPSLQCDISARYLSSRHPGYKN